MENNKVQPHVQYDEDKGIFTIKSDSILNYIGIGNTILHEKDLSIRKINELKEQADMTTLGDHDIDMLYDFTNLEYGSGLDRNQFIDKPLKEIYPDMSNDKLMVHKLMIVAYDYLQNVKNGKKPVIEKFSEEAKVNDMVRNGFLLFLFMLIIIVSVVYFRL